MNRICYVLDKETGESTISKKIEALRDDLNFEMMSLRYQGEYKKKEDIFQLFYKVGFI